MKYFCTHLTHTIFHGFHLILFLFLERRGVRRASDWHQTRLNLSQEYDANNKDRGQMTMLHLYHPQYTTARSRVKSDDAPLPGYTRP